MYEFLYFLVFLALVGEDGQVISTSNTNRRGTGGGRCSHSLFQVARNQRNIYCDQCNTSVNTEVVNECTECDYHLCNRCLPARSSVPIPVMPSISLPRAIPTRGATRRRVQQPQTQVQNQFPRQRQNAVTSMLGLMQANDSQELRTVTKRASNGLLTMCSLHKKFLLRPYDPKVREINNFMKQHILFRFPGFVNSCRCNFLSI